MNGFDEEAWVAILRDPRIGGESQWMGDGAGEPFPWQVDVVADEPQSTPSEIADQVAEILSANDGKHLPGWIDTGGNVPLDAFGLPDL